MVKVTARVTTEESMPLGEGDGTDYGAGRHVGKQTGGLYSMGNMALIENMGKGRVY
jgi:hypothetical protein